MTQTTIYLRFDDHDEALAAFRAIGLTVTDEDGQETFITDSHTHSIAVRGVITRPGTYDADGTELSPPVVFSGYHIDWAAAYRDLPVELEPFQVAPRKPLFRY